MKPLFLFLVFGSLINTQAYSELPDFTNQRTISDSDIRAKINNTLKSGSYNRISAFVTFQVDRGFVFLDGHVESEIEKNQIEATVRTIEGVRGIRSDIKVYGLKSRFEDPTYY